MLISNVKEMVGKRSARLKKGSGGRNRARGTVSRNYALGSIFYKRNAWSNNSRSIKESSDSDVSSDEDVGRSSLERPDFKQLKESFNRARSKRGGMANCESTGSDSDSAGMMIESDDENLDECPLKIRAPSTRQRKNVNYEDFNQGGYTTDGYDRLLAEEEEIHALNSGNDNHNVRILDGQKFAVMGRFGKIRKNTLIEKLEGFGGMHCNYKPQDSTLILIGDSLGKTQMKTVKAFKQANIGVKNTIWTKNQAVKFGKNEWIPTTDDLPKRSRRRQNSEADFEEELEEQADESNFDVGEDRLSPGDVAEFKKDGQIAHLKIIKYSSAKRVEVKFIVPHKQYKFNSTWVAPIERLQKADSKRQEILKAFDEDPETQFITPIEFIAVGSRSDGMQASVRIKMGSREEMVVRSGRTRKEAEMHLFEKIYEKLKTFSALSAKRGLTSVGKALKKQNREVEKLKTSEDRFLTLFESNKEILDELKVIQKNVIQRVDNVENSVTDLRDHVDEEFEKHNERIEDLEDNKVKWSDFQKFTQQVKKNQQLTEQLKKLMDEKKDRAESSGMKRRMTVVEGELARVATERPRKKVKRAAIGGANVPKPIIAQTPAIVLFPRRRQQRYRRR